MDRTLFSFFSYRDFLGLRFLHQEKFRARFSSLFVLVHGLVILQLLNFSSRDHCNLTEKILKPDGEKEDAFEGGVKIARNYLTALGACNLSGSKPDSDSKGETTDQS